MRHVEIHTFNRSIRSVAGDFVEFHSMPGLNLNEGWQRVCDGETFVRHIEPVHRFVDLDGSEVFVAMDRRTLDILSMACDESLRAQVRDMGVKLASANNSLAALCEERDAWMRLAESTIKGVHAATLWDRIKYVFTRRL